MSIPKTIKPRRNRFYDKGFIFYSDSEAEAHEKNKCNWTKYLEISGLKETDIQYDESTMIGYIGKVKKYSICGIYDGLLLAFNFMRESPITNRKSLSCNEYFNN